MHPAAAYYSTLILSLAGIVVVYGLGMAGIYALPWMMFLTATLASVRGLWVGLAAALGSSVALSFFPRAYPDFYVMILILFLSAYLAFLVGDSLRRAHRRAKQLVLIQDVLLQGLELIPRYFTQRQLLQNLPTMLSSLLQGVELRVWVPAGANLVQPLEIQAVENTDTSSTPPLVLRALMEDGPVYSEGSATQVAMGRHVGMTGKPAELAVATRVRQEVVAVLQFTLGETWRKLEADLFNRLARTIAYQLERLHDHELRRLLLELASALANENDKTKVAKVTLRHLLPAMEMEAGAVLIYRRGALQALSWQLPESLEPVLATSPQRLEHNQGIAWQALEAGAPLFVENYLALPEGLPELKQVGIKTFAVYPIYSRDAFQSRTVLVLAHRKQIPWSRKRKEILLGVERLLSSALERVLLAEQQQRINQLLTEAWSYPSKKVYQDILEAAVELVPGSEVGSLWVRVVESYCCQAAIGNLSVRAVQSETELLAWYGGSSLQALKGVPRILTGHTPQFDELKASLCLPVGHQGQVLAYLNLGSTKDPNAFAEDSLAAVQLFAAPLATLIHELNYRSELEKASLTDSLTGLYNRRAFNLRLQEETSRATRSGYPLTLIVMDLGNFKPINDRLGHALGDLALQEVAKTLVRELRSGDIAFRWGGDEFAVLLSQTDAQGAQHLSRRLEQAISKVCIENICLSVDIGQATFPIEANTPQALLSLADQRMYEAKKTRDTR